MSKNTLFDFAEQTGNTMDPALWHRLHSTSFHARPITRHQITNRKAIDSVLHQENVIYSRLSDDSAFILFNPLPKQMLERISKLSKLQPAWDSYSGKPISTTAIEYARSVLKMLRERLSEETFNKVFIAPCSNGSVQLEWKTDEREYVIGLPIDETKNIEYYYSDVETEDEGELDSFVGFEEWLDKYLPRERIFVRV